MKKLKKNKNKVNFLKNSKLEFKIFFKIIKLTLQLITLKNIQNKK